MKNLITTLLALTLSLGAIAEVPSLINYQGKLSDESGNPVNGTKTFSLKIYDAKTGGKEIYQEGLGNVALRNGVYSFGFGEAGKSVSTATETIGFTDGDKQVFNYTVKNTPILGETKISASDYSWTENGSSDATKFTATENKSSGAISAIFIAGVPEANKQITISYDHHSDGVIGALSRGGQAWLELIVDNKAMSPRERLVTVPFALKSLESVSTRKLPESLIFRCPGYIGETSGNRWFGEKKIYKWNKNYEINVFIPTGAKYVTYKQDDFTYKLQGTGYGGGTYKVKLRLRIDDSVSNIISAKGNHNQQLEFKNAIFRLDVQETGYKKVYLEFYESDNSIIGKYTVTRSEIDQPKNIFIHAHFD